MKITLRQYQKQASDAAVSFFKNGASRGGLIVIPTGGGKSVLLADIAHRLGQPILIFCPSREIILQNYGKMEAIESGISSMYSASVGQKKISMITFATIGSVKNHPHDFDVFRYVCVDEAHSVNAKGGMYEEFIHRRADRKVLGVTATPYRLAPAFDGGSMLKFLTRTRPRIFDKVLYVCQVTDLLAQGYLADPTYFDVSDKTSFDITRVRTNTTGADYDEESLKLELERSGFAQDLFNWVMRVRSPKDGSKRNGILVFTRFVKESEQLVSKLTENGVKAAIVTGDTPKKERERIVNAFKSGEIQVVSNAACLSVGFDYPELDTVVLARPTKSLALYYQQVGRCVRPCKGKRTWVVDLTSNVRRFGKVSDLRIGLEKPNSELWAVFSKGRKLTNTLIV